MPALVRVLFVSDTHLGFDLPFRPRIDVRRRGPDFFANFERALEPALSGECDLVVHGGDLLYRSRVPCELTRLAMAPIQRVAERGVAVYLVPGNHERSRIPHPLLSLHDNIHIFDRPRTFCWTRGNLVLALSGFPYVRNVRRKFSSIVGQLAWRSVKADGRILCMHHAVEGARVGPRGYAFRHEDEAVRQDDLPRGMSIVLSGHLHRAQALTHQSDGTRLPAPVVYAGSIERTSFSEKNEKKGYVEVAFEASGHKRGRLVGWRFRELPTRPMREITLPEAPWTRDNLAGWLSRRLRGLDAESIVRIRVDVELPAEVWSVLRASSLRRIAPPSMMVGVSVGAHEKGGNYRR